MHKLIIKLSTHVLATDCISKSSDHSEEKVIFVEDIYDIQEVLNKVEPLVSAIEDRDKLVIEIRVCDGEGTSLLHGSVQNGSFNGVSFS